MKAQGSPSDTVSFSGEGVNPRALGILQDSDTEAGNTTTNVYNQPQDHRQTQRGGGERSATPLSNAELESTRQRGGGDFPATPLPDVKFESTGTPPESTLNKDFTSTLLIDQQQEVPVTVTMVTTAKPTGGVDDARGRFWGGGEMVGERLSLADVALVGEWMPHSEAVVSLEVGT